MCEWFAREARDLPWRRRRSGYTALVSEAMLQQTQVARVVERYRGFVRRFPSVRALASAAEESVLAEWRGMGYYRRARNLRAAARMVVAEFGGRVPRTSAELRRLPGVGRYSAGAIASIVYGAREAVVDGNVQRVLARVEGRPGRAHEKEFVEWAWGRAGELVAVAEAPGEFNEGLMELGAVVCLPRGPKCEVCPLASLCVARRMGRQEEFPGAKERVRRVRVHHHAVVVRDRGKVLLERRPEDGMWGRMWQVPTVEARRVLGVGEVEGKVGVVGLRKQGSFVHQTTHRVITFHVLVAKSKGESRKSKVESWDGERRVWRGVGELDELPMSNAQRKVLKEVLSLES